MDKTIEQAICKVTGVEDAEKWGQCNSTAVQIAQEAIKLLTKDAVNGLIADYYLNVISFRKPLSKDKYKAFQRVKVIILPSDNK